MLPKREDIDRMLPKREDRESLHTADNGNTHPITHPDQGSSKAIEIPRYLVPRGNSNNIIRSSFSADTTVIRDIAHFLKVQEIYFAQHEDKTFYLLKWTNNTNLFIARSRNQFWAILTNGDSTSDSRSYNTNERGASEVTRTEQISTGCRVNASCTIDHITPVNLTIMPVFRNDSNNEILHYRYADLNFSSFGRYISESFLFSAGQSILPQRLPQGHINSPSTGSLTEIEESTVTGTNQTSTVTLLNNMIDNSTPADQTIVPFFQSNSSYEVPNYRSVDLSWHLCASFKVICQQNLHTARFQNHLLSVDKIILKNRYDGSSSEVFVKTLCDLSKVNDNNVYFRPNLSREDITLSSVGTVQAIQEIESDSDNETVITEFESDSNDSYTSDIRNPNWSFDASDSDSATSSNPSLGICGPGDSLELLERQEKLIITSENLGNYYIGKAFFSRIIKDEELVIDGSREDLLSKIMGWLYLKACSKNAQFEEGAYVIEDSNGRIFNFLSSIDSVSIRMSSHFAERSDSYSHRGVDVDNLLPAGKKHVLFCQVDKLNSEEKLLFIKPENYGLSTFKDLTLHSLEYIHSFANRYLFNSENSCKHRKERIPEDDKKLFEKFLNELSCQMNEDGWVEVQPEENDEAMRRNARIFGWSFIKNEWDKRNRDLSPNSEIFNIIEKELRKRDYLDIRTGHEVIFGLEELIEDIDPDCYVIQEATS